jgi:hypothetical protein
VAVLVIEIAVPVDEPHDRSSIGSRRRDGGPEGVVDALLIDVRLITGMTEREDAKTAIGLNDQAPVDVLDGVGVRGAQSNPPVEVLPLPGCSFSSTVTST